MTIEEYLYETRPQTGPTSYDDETKAFYNQLQSIVEASGLLDIQLIITNTCRAQCSVVYLHGKKYIIWDLSYWGIIDNYLDIIEIFADGYHECAHLAYNHLLYRALRYRLNNKKEKNALLKVEQNLAKNMIEIIPKSSTGKHNPHLYFDLFKLFVFTHEIYHIKFKEDTILRQQAIQEFDYYITTIRNKENLFYVNESIYSDIDYSNKINSSEAINQYFKNDDIKTEAMCDLYAFDSLSNLFVDLEKALAIPKEQLLSDFCSLKDAIIGFYDDVLYYQKYIERLTSNNKTIDNKTILESAKGFYDLANLYLVRESLFNPLFLCRYYLKNDCIIRPQVSPYYDLYNELNHKSLRNNYLKEFIDNYNAL